MRYIDITKLREKAIEINWDSIRGAHLLAMQGMSEKDRKEYINNHPDWNQFQAAMLSLSHNKCWYSESQIGNSDFEVDHFRPKNHAKNHDKAIIKENGYWWKAYDWDNYRLTGALANKRRRDRLKENAEVKGKGTYFPLDLINGAIAEDESPIGCEVPLLLDPTNEYDVTLLSFDEKGEPIPASQDQYEVNRVTLSILYYHLDLDQLNIERKIAWDDCVVEINDAKKAIDESPNIAAKSLMMAKCFKGLRRLVKENDRPYTCVRKACLFVYSELDGYNWLKDFIRTL
ncbi:HNH endonuclease family protein [Chitinophaga sancti]|uniref:TIGR02646 family protein n=1 Tax=Chitinophaga sancti TaxID=1004 RepID=A0A1K1S7G2_9BACT|nr:hypothetical protein [Chitinophaga sancti]WQD62136.1 hypothetical protein U0033_30055 [Chitinophaga sancti]WQG92295.1 hypothetical protein SR876_12330 [Chitinophaga sancti]SFW80305.1 hypothetical protein SAMN05661012_04937 [Chitinophaga sancti]